MQDWIVPALLALCLLLLLWIALRRSDGAPLERLERELRDEISRQGQATRADLGTFQQMLLAQSGDVARTQNEQIDSFRTQLATTQQAVSQTLTQATQSLAGQAQGAREAQDAALRRFGDALAEQLRLLADGNERRLGEVKAVVETRLATLQEGNEKKLDQMRATVDEKLHATLEQRLGESFKQVADRLEQVHKGLGEMQTLARDVGSLNRVLTNVKTRGIYGEVQLAGLLEQVFTPDQYEANVETVPGSGARVEYAVRLPGRREDGVPLWLPIDAKFPRDDYERLIEAQERADPVAADIASKAIEARLRLEAKTIRDKYIAAPPWSGGRSATRSPHHAGRADDAAGHAVEPADGLSHARSGAAQCPGLGGAGRGEDRVRQIRRRAGAHAQEARRSHQHDRCRGGAHTGDDAPAQDRGGLARPACSGPAAGAGRRRARRVGG
jgi:DNA recombination protein RmuC